MPIEARFCVTASLDRNGKHEGGFLVEATCQIFVYIVKKKFHIIGHADTLSFVLINVIKNFNIKYTRKIKIVATTKKYLRVILVHFKNF